MGPKTFTTNDFLALNCAPIKPELRVQFYDFGIRKWVKPTDTTVAQTALDLANENMPERPSLGDRLFIGDIEGHRVIVQVVSQ